MNKYAFFLTILLGCVTVSGFSQKERKFIREGNDLFGEEKFENSEVSYRKALEKKGSSFAASFNLGDALFKQEKYDEALAQFQSLAAMEKNPENLGRLYHNIGNTLLMQNKIDESIEAYKQSLRNYPDAKETKYNLEYARHLKKKQEQQKQQSSNDQQDQNQQKDQKNQKDQKQQEQKEKNQPQSQQEQNQNQAQRQEGKISEEDAKRLLEALENDEKKIQEKVQKARAKQKRARKAKIKKDW